MQVVSRLKKTQVKKLPDNEVIAKAQKKLRNKRYYELNKECIKARASEYYCQHRDTKIAHSAEYQILHKDKKKIWNLRDIRRVRAELLVMMGSKCIVCGTTKKIEVDHKLGEGSKERLERFGGNNNVMYRYYLKHLEEAKEKLQLLCKDHNLDKQRRNNNEQRPRRKAEPTITAIPAMTTSMTSSKINLDAYL